MKVIWAPEAERDRLDIWDYIAADNPVAAVHMESYSALLHPLWLAFPTRGNWERSRAPENLLTTKMTALSIKLKMTRYEFLPWYM